MAILQDTFMQQLRETFAAEAKEHLHAISTGLLALENGPGDTGMAILLAEMFRAAHSLKGAARAVGLEEVATLAHHLESILGLVRSGARPVAATPFDVLYATVDALAILTEPAGGDRAGIQLDALVARLAAAANPAALPVVNSQPDAACVRPTPGNATSVQRPDGVTAATQTVAVPLPATEPAQVAPLSQAEAAGGGAWPRTATAPEESVRVATAKLDTIIEQVGELQVARLANELHMRRLAALVEEIEQAMVEARKQRLAWQPAAGSPEQSDAEARTRSIGAMTADLRRLYRDMQVGGRHEAQLVDDLEEYVLRTRLMPVGSVLESFPRMVRDLAHALNKQLQLTITGGDTEVDRSVLEQIKAPLTHLLRNSVDHGIETPEERVAAGKNAEGHITVSAAPRGSSIVIEVQDDGRGIDRAAVRAGAIRRGVVDSGEADRLSEHDLLWLIFRSGMSTRTEVTDVSGRGVGLDVVREHVERLRGYIDVASVQGQGTRFSLHLPLSVATTLCLIVECRDTLFAVPASSVFRVKRVQRQEIGRAEGRDVVRIGDQVLALHDLATLLAMPAPPSPVLADDAVYALLLGIADQRVAIAVDAVHEVQELVVKPLPAPLGHVPHIAGASNLGTGAITLVLNAADVVRTAIQGIPQSSIGVTLAARAMNDEPAQARSAPSTILVADDSFTTRSLERNILETAGYTVRVAADGMEAWLLLQREPVDLVVSDVMMPHMTGFELTSRIRGDKHLGNLPVVLVTAQESPQDREQGLAAGADAYLVKSAFDQDNLLTTIERLI